MPSPAGVEFFRLDAICVTGRNGVSYESKVRSTIHYAAFVEALTDSVLSRKYRHHLGTTASEDTVTGSSTTGPGPEVPMALAAS